DLRGFLDQVVEALRGAIVGAGTEPAIARHSLVALTAAARRLAAIDPTRAGVGGLRLQLELALFPDPAVAPVAAWPPVHASVAPQAQPAMAASKPKAESPVPATERPVADGAAAEPTPVEAPAPPSKTSAAPEPSEVER